MSHPASTTSTAPPAPASTSPVGRGVPPTAADASDPLVESFATFDLFDLGRRASAARNARLGPFASFVRGRQLLPTGAWRGPRDATEGTVEAVDLATLGGWPAAQAAGVTLVAGVADRALHQQVLAGGGRLLWRLPYHSAGGAAERRVRRTAIEALRATVRDGLPIWGVMPTPEGEAEGLDTLRLAALLRLELPEIPHVVLDVAALGPRLAQMALGFGADELWAPIVSERALRLGGNANNPAMTRKEAVILIRGAGLAPRERTGPETFCPEPA